MKPSKFTFPVKVISQLSIVHVYCGAIPNNIWNRPTRLLADECRENVTCAHRTILLTPQKEWNHVIFCNMDGTVGSA